MDQSHPKIGVKVLEQAIQVLRLLGNGSGDKSVRELAEDLNISKTTVQRILVSLERAGLATLQQSTQKYELGVGILELATSYLRQSDLISVAKPYLQRLWEATGETICLSTIVDDARVAIFQLESRDPLRFTTEVGRRYPLYAGATSRALLACLPLDTARAVVDRTALCALTPETATTTDEVIRRVERVLRCGYAISHAEYVPGGAGLAVPIKCDNLPCAVSLYAPDQRLTSDMIANVLPEMQSAAKKIAEILTKSEVQV